MTPLSGWENAILMVLNLIAELVSRNVKNTFPK